MKQIKCRDMGGPETCNHIITGETAQEMIDNGWKHMEEAHPEQVKNIRSNPEAENNKWMDEFKSKFDSLEDAETAEAV